MKRVGALFEVALVLALFHFSRNLLRSSGFSDWQLPLFGGALVSSCLLLFVLPLIAVLVAGRDPGSCGLTTDNLRYHRLIALRALAFVAPTTVLFPVIGMLGTTPMEWMGAGILTAGFAATGLLFATRSRSLANSFQADFPWRGLGAYIALLVVGLMIIYLLHLLSPLASRVVTVLIFVGFLEEFFFRGYVQSRLNDCFGKPYRFQNVEFGAGLVISAVAFGLFHPLSVANELPWAWALWTAALGLTLGFLREKTGAVVAPALFHGAILLPGVFFGPS